MKITAMLLSLLHLYSYGLFPAGAASISDGGATSAAIQMGARNYFLPTNLGNNLGGS
jgi:hypothetical protein